MLREEIALTCEIAAETVVQNTCPREPFEMSRVKLVGRRRRGGNGGSCGRRRRVKSRRRTRKQRRRISADRGWSARRRRGSRCRAQRRPAHGARIRPLIARLSDDLAVPVSGARSVVLAARTALPAVRRVFFEIGRPVVRSGRMLGRIGRLRLEHRVRRMQAAEHVGPEAYRLAVSAEYQLRMRLNRRNGVTWRQFVLGQKRVDAK